MNIHKLPDSLQPQGLRIKNKATADSPGTTGASGTGLVAGVDKVALSQTSQQLQRAENGSVAVNAEKVEKLKKAIAEGTYSVNSTAIADKMIAHHEDMMRATAPKS